MKTIGILFDVSGSMKKKFDNLNKVKEVGKKSDELVNILKKLSRNIQANIFTLLFWLLDEPYFIDFIKLLKIYNSQLKELTCNDEINTETIFRDKLISYLSKDKDGKDRYCNIREYVMSNNGPSEKLSEFFCNLMEEERSIIDNIYNHLPEEVTDKNKNENFQTKKEVGKVGAIIGGGIWGMGRGIEAGMELYTIVIGLSTLGIAIPITPLSIGIASVYCGYKCAKNYAQIGNDFIDDKVKKTEKEETLKAIRDSFKQSIEIITEKVMNYYKEEKITNYKLIKGSQLYELIENLNKKIISPKEQSYNIIDIFDKFIYGNTPLYTTCMKAFEIFESENSRTKILLIISDGLLKILIILKNLKKILKQK